MIKIKLRRNLLYLFVYYIAYLYYIFGRGGMSRPIIFEFFPMSFGKIVGGLIKYLYQNHFIKRKKRNNIILINIIDKINKAKPKDSKIKIVILIFFASFFIFLDTL